MWGQPLLRPPLAEIDEHLPVEMNQLLPLQSHLEHLRRPRLRSPRRLRHLLHVVDMQINQFPEGPQTRRTLRRRHFAAINPPLGFIGPPPRVIAFEEGLTYSAPSF